MEQVAPQTGLRAFPRKFRFQSGQICKKFQLAMYLRKILGTGVLRGWYCFKNVPVSFVEVGTIFPYCITDAID
eukprot:g34216.t1